ncbi:MAG TPA: hypothetical protein PLI00_10080 [Pseudomonadota bacterium]|nr:hypothetical protein [Pseudomonadota bacterium]HQY36918.1 hypothetical protein [Pseudomonadota bacterium]
MSARPETLQLRRGHRFLAVIVSLALLLQAAVVGACEAHDAVHAMVGHAESAGAVADGSGATELVDAPSAVHQDGRLADGERSLLHVVFHATHCGCAHAAATAAQPALPPAAIVASIPPAFDAITFEPARLSPLLRPPTTA